MEHPFSKQYVMQQDKKTPLPKPQLDLFEQTNVSSDPNREAIRNE